MAARITVDASAPVFDVGIDDRVPVSSAIGLGVQNILGMAGLLIFPALIGTAFHLTATDTAYLYGVTFMTSGLVVILQSLLLLRLPIIQGPYAGSLAALLAVGHGPGGLGAAFGSMTVAGAIWCVLAIPARRFGPVTYLAKFVRDPIICGVLILILATQLTSTALPNWLGAPNSPGFPWVNVLAGAVAAALVIALTLLPKGTLLRRGAVLAAVIAGTVVYALLAPTNFAAVGENLGFTVPKPFPFGFAVNGELVLVFSSRCSRPWRKALPPMTSSPAGAARSCPGSGWPRACSARSSAAPSARSSAECPHWPIPTTSACSG